ncbi:hypothetical protein D3C81_665110 [compost metagenome]
MNILIQLPMFMKKDKLDKACKILDLRLSKKVFVGGIVSKKYRLDVFCHPFQVSVLKTILQQYEKDEIK